MQGYWAGTWTQPTFVYLACWFAVVSCFAYTCEAARRVAKRPTLFMALALFAGAWVLAAAAIGVRLDAIKAEAAIPTAVEAAALTPAAIEVLISFTKRSATEFADRAAAVAAFLFVFTGACLAREVPHKRRLQRLQELLQVAGLFTLFCLVLPQRLPINPPALTSTQMTMLTGRSLVCSASSPWGSECPPSRPADGPS